jgi:hypothetical protein
VLAARDLKKTLDGQTLSKNQPLTGQRYHCRLKLSGWDGLGGHYESKD